MMGCMVEEGGRIGPDNNRQNSVSTTPAPNYDYDYDYDYDYGALREVRCIRG